MYILLVAVIYALVNLYSLCAISYLNTQSYVLYNAWKIVQLCSTITVPGITLVQYIMANSRNCTVLLVAIQQLSVQYVMLIVVTVLVHNVRELNIASVLPVPQQYELIQIVHCTTAVVFFVHHAAIWCILFCTTRHRFVVSPYKIIHTCTYPSLPVTRVLYLGVVCIGTRLPVVSLNQLLPTVVHYSRDYYLL